MTQHTGDKYTFLHIHAHFLHIFTLHIFTHPCAQEVSLFFKFFKTKDEHKVEHKTIFDNFNTSIYMHLRN